MVFITIVTFIGTFSNLSNYLNDGNWLLVVIAAIIGICQIWIIWEAVLAFRKKGDPTPSKE